MNPTFNFESIKPVTAAIPTVSTRLNWADYWGAIKVRWDIGRDSYTVKPGLYKVGKPTKDSDVLVSANYKLSFDVLRKNLSDLNAWILVIDTKGVNVWCAAGKGTFGTNNLVKSIKDTSLELIVNQRTLIVPQLGAVGVSAYKVKEQSGFNVIFGPVQAKDIKTYIAAGYKATRTMRTIQFPFWQRAKLIPVDLMYGKYKLLIILAILFFLSGLDRSGFLFGKMLNTSTYPLISILGAYLAGLVVAPLLLPLVPFREFALKGALWGFVLSILLFKQFQPPIIETISISLIIISISSFSMMNFTGSSTYTSLSGVKKEMKWAVPTQIVFAAVGLVLFICSKLL